MTECVDCRRRPATVFLPEGRYLCRPCWLALRDLRAAVVRDMKHRRRSRIVIRRGGAIEP